MGSAHFSPKHQSRFCLVVTAFLDLVTNDWIPFCTHLLTGNWPITVLHHVKLCCAHTSIVFNFPDFLLAIGVKTRKIFWKLQHFGKQSRMLQTQSLNSTLDPKFLDNPRNSIAVTVQKNVGRNDITEPHRYPQNYECTKYDNKSSIDKTPWKVREAHQVWNFATYTPSSCESFPKTYVQLWNG